MICHTQAYFRTKVKGQADWLIPRRVMPILRSSPSTTTGRLDSGDVVWVYRTVTTQFHGMQPTLQQPHSECAKHLRWVYPKVSGLAAWSENCKWYSSATRCSCIAILWASLVSFAAITLCVASQRMSVVYFVIDLVQKLLDIPSYMPMLSSVQRAVIVS
jgi:hypothetical protein